MAANSLLSRSAGTGGGGKHRNLASKDSGPGFSDLSGGMIGNLVIHQNSQSVDRLRGAPFECAARLLKHGSTLAIAQTLQVVQHQNRALRDVQTIEELI